MTWGLVLVYLAIIIPCDSWLGAIFFPHEAPDSAVRKTLKDCILLVAVGAAGDWTNCTLSGVLQVRLASGSFYVGASTCALLFQATKAITWQPSA